MKSKIRKALPLFLTMYTFEASATQILDASGDAELSGVIARDELSRIKVISDRIASVKSNEGMVEILDDAKLGEVYIRPSRSTNDPVNLFITTEQGYTYKLLLLPQSIPSEQVFIKNDEAVIKSIKEQTSTDDTYKEEIVALIKGMRGENKVEGYIRKLHTERKQIGKYKLKKTATYRGKDLKGEVFEFKNAKKEPLILDYEDFTNNRTRAISLDEMNIDASQVTKIYIISEVESE